jgi:hypothetical protein
VEQELSSEAVRARFNKLIGGILNGELPSRGYQQWEVDLLLDMQSASAGSGRKRNSLMRRYQRAADKQLADGSTRPMPFSEFLAKVTEEEAVTLKT